MQLMPATSRQYGVANPFDAQENVRAGVAYLRALLDRYQNDETLALASREGALAGTRGSMTVGGMLTGWNASRASSTPLHSKKLIGQTPQLACKRLLRCRMRGQRFVKDCRHLLDENLKLVS